MLKRVQRLAAKPDILIVEDQSFDAAALATALRLVFGADVAVRIATKVSEMRAAVTARLPTIVLLDDRLAARTTAEATLPLLRQDGFAGAVIVLAGLLTKQRQAELMRLGAFEVIHKDDIDSTRVGETILRAMGEVIE